MLLILPATYIEERQKHCPEQTKPDQKKICTILFHLYDTLETASYSGRK